MRYGVALVTGVFGLAAMALALVPLALQRPRPTLPDVVPGTTTVFAVPLDGATPHVVAQLKGQYNYPTPSADGRSLLVTKSTLLGNTGIWSVPVRGGGPRWVGPATYNGMPSWSPDRKRLVVSDWTGMTNFVAVFDTKGQRLRTLTTHRGEGGTSQPSWGGRNVAFIRLWRPRSGYRLDVEVWHATGGRAWSRRIAFPNGSVALAPDGQRMALLQVHKLQLLTRHTRRLLATDAAGFTLPVWTPDGRTLVYFDQKNRLVREDVATRRRHVLAAGRVGYPSVSPDGKTVYVVGFAPKAAVSIPK